MRALMISNYSFILFIALAPAWVFAEQLLIGNFNDGKINDWKNKSIKGKTEYNVEKISGEKVVCASANDSSSALGVQHRVNIHEFRILNWSWKIITPLPPLNEKTKDGHDFAARITIIDRIGMTGLKSHTINYVYAPGQEENSRWPNPFNSRSINISVQSNEVDDLGFTVFKRDVAEDFKKSFGESPKEIDGIAIVSDADNSGGKAKSCYGNIWFSQ